MAKANKQAIDPLLHLTYVLQHLSDTNLSAIAGVGLSQVRLMSVLNDTVTHSQIKIAHDLQQTEANVSRQIRLMKKDGLVSIERNKKDARIRDVKLTGNGARKYKMGVKVLATQQKELLKLLDKKEVKAFERASSNLLAALSIEANTHHHWLLTSDEG